MPTAKDLQRQMKFDLATRNALRERGDNETKIHSINHRFIAYDKAALAAIARTGGMLGFGYTAIAQEIDESGSPYWYLDLISESPTDLPNLARESLLMLTLGEAYGASYNGWGTFVVK